MWARVVFTVLIALLACPALAQDRAATRPSDRTAGTDSNRGDGLRVYLMTLGPGSIIYERFGHNLIVIHDPHPSDQRIAERDAFEKVHGRFRSVPLIAPTDRAYHYGAFDFGGDFIPRFIMGRMRYWMTSDWADVTALIYGKVDQRLVRMQELDLTSAQKLALEQFLEDNTKTENKYYHYDYYRDNCSTRVRDALDNAVGGELKRQLAALPTGTTYRSHTRRLTSGLDPLDIWWFTAFTYVLGHPVDEPLSAWEESFLPEELSVHVANVKLPDGSAGSSGGGKPLVIGDQVIFDSSHLQLPTHPPRRIAGYLVAGLLVCGTFASLARAAAIARSRVARGAFILLVVPWTLLWALGGSIAAWGWTVTDHSASYRNENLLQASPLFWPLVLLGPVVAAGRRRGAKLAARLATVIAGLSVLGFLLQALPPFWQHNGEIVALMTPANLGLAFAMTMFWKQAQAKRLLETKRERPHEQAPAR